MTLTEIAQKYNLRIRRDSCGDLMIPGKLGKSHIYEISKSTLGMIVIPPSQKIRTWKIVKQTAENAGMTLRQNGDREGTFSFSSSNRTLLRLAIKLIEARQPRNLTEEQRVAIRERLKAGREKNEATPFKRPLKTAKKRSEPPKTIPSTTQKSRTRAK